MNYCHSTLGVHCNKSEYKYNIFSTKIHMKLADILFRLNKASESSVMWWTNKASQCCRYVLKHSNENNSDGTKPLPEKNIDPDLHCHIASLGHNKYVRALQSTPMIARFMGPTWGPSGADRTQVGPMLAPWTLLSSRTATTIKRDIMIILVYLQCTKKMCIIMDVL